MASVIDFLPTISSCQAVSQINLATARWGAHAGYGESAKLVRKTSEPRHSVSVGSSNAPIFCCAPQYFPRTALRLRGEVKDGPRRLLSRFKARCRPGLKPSCVAARNPLTFERRRRDEAAEFALDQP